MSVSKEKPDIVDALIGVFSRFNQECSNYMFDRIYEESPSFRAWMNNRRHSFFGARQAEQAEVA